MRLRLSLTGPTTGTSIPLPWHRATQATMETDEHGCAALSVTLPLSVRRALPLVSDGMGLDLACYAGGKAIWRGRVEEPGLHLSADGSELTLTAYGYQQAFDDIPYTALWSDRSYDGWRVVQSTDPGVGVGSAAPERYSIDNQGRLFIGLTKNASYGAFAHQGRLRYDVPRGSTRSIMTMAADYALLAPTGWKADIYGYDASGTYLGGTPWTLTATGSLQTGTLMAALPALTATVVVALYTPTTTTYAGETGASFLRLLNVTMMTAATVTPAAIVSDMLSAVRAVNPSQLSGVTSRIQTTGLTLPDESYLDANMRDVLDTLAAYGDSATPPNRWTWRVWADQVLRYEPLSTDTRTYTVSVGDYQADRALKQTYAEVYAAYTDSSGMRQVTSTVSVSNPPRIIRRLAVQSQSTTSAQATQERAAALSDQGDPLPRVSMTITRLSDANGATVPTWRLRAGDVVQVRDLAPSLSTTVDRFRRFRVIHTSYDMIADTIDVDLESPQPQLEWLLARRSIGY